MIEVNIQAGDQIEVDQCMLVLEGEKATMEVPSTHAGQIEDVNIKVGDTVNAGDQVATIQATVVATKKYKPQPLQVHQSR